ncbi:hypothetical protein BGX31_009435 [Mortierella sp. GBA43]|nr:hypothetical protein BGX31_009435 [Mortierella sp. GBA43]
MASPDNSPYSQPLTVNQHPYTPPHPSSLTPSLSQAHPLGVAAGWITDDGGQGGSKTYSFVPLSGVNTKKRPRRRFDEIDRNYSCNWGDCEKAYGTLNHLNAHVSMQKHGPKRHPSEFKEFRKEWRRKKKAQEEAAKQVVIQHQQHQQHQQQLQFGLAETIMPTMHPQAHPMALHTMPHQPHQLSHQLPPHPPLHAHQYAPHHAHGPTTQHPMGF